MVPSWVAPQKTCGYRRLADRDGKRDPCRRTRHAAWPIGETGIRRCTLWQPSTAHYAVPPKRGTAHGSTRSSFGTKLTRLALTHGHSTRRQEHCRSEGASREDQSVQALVQHHYARAKGPRHEAAGHRG